MPLLCYLHFSFIFDKTYVQKNMKTKLIEKAKQISTEYKFGDFFRNFLAVILGIIITFAGSDWITEHNAQKEVKESILLVKSELQTNREDIAYIKELVELEQKGALYLLEYKGRIQEADPDSLQKYDTRSAWPDMPVSWQISACTSMDSPKSFTLSAPSSRERPSVFTA